ncbi:MAG TPA: GTP 3',8-cyclase MoaA [Candidatus Limnocylindrales bacterium]|nr:GTP 3',8-cyclase MoaA [Candidatus Limnocylindrales bacterium]
MPLVDLHGRKHDYLRVSVTDRCNLRCVYCMGPAGIEQIPHSEILTYEEIMQVISAGVELGITKVRITGGEPLIRNELIELIRQIASLPGIADLAMTTNGILLPTYAAELRQAGLKRVNISLDSLNPAVYRDITRGGNLQQALDGIDAALQADLGPVKLNTVLMKDINHTEVLDFLKLTLEKPLHVRFIEYMPIGDMNCNHRGSYLPLSFVKEAAHEAGMVFTATPLAGGAGPAETFILTGGKGTVGMIHPISRHFCGSCNRLRLTAEGCLKTCLYWQDEQSVRPALGNPDALRELLKNTLLKKPVEHQMSVDGGFGTITPELMRTMSKIGG